VGVNPTRLYAPARSNRRNFSLQFVGTVQKPALSATRKNPDIKALHERLLAADKTKVRPTIVGHG